MSRIGVFLGMLIVSFADLIFIAAALFQFAGAANLPSSEKHINARKAVNWFHSVSVIGRDDRVTITEERQLNEFPIRKFYCGDKLVTASLVAKTNIVLTAGHIFHDQNCELIPNAEECFLYDNDEEQYQIDIDSLVSGIQSLKAEGRSCSMPDTTNLSERDPQVTSHDWAVVKLKRNVKNVRPLSVKVPSVGQARYTYLAVAAAAWDLPKPRNKMMNVQSCEWRDSFVDENNSLSYMIVDCDSAGWMSGAPVINEFREVEGIIVHGSDQPDGLSYSSFNNTWASPVSREMVVAIDQLAQPPD
jgi:V8-like Glu-specific endopeptidase